MVSHNTRVKSEKKKKNVHLDSIEDTLADVLGVSRKYKYPHSGGAVESKESTPESVDSHGGPA